MITYLKDFLRLRQKIIANVKILHFLLHANVLKLHLEIFWPEQKKGSHTGDNHHVQWGFNSEFSKEEKPKCFPYVFFRCASFHCEPI